MLAAVAFGLIVSRPSGATRTTFYVSPRGDDSSSRSWAHAWSELSGIRWDLVRPGDVVSIDGGGTACRSGLGFVAGPDAPAAGLHCGMAYRTPLRVGASGRAGSPVTVALSQQSGHDGTAVLLGGRTTALPYCDQRDHVQAGVAGRSGIEITGRSHLVIDGRHRSGIVVYGSQTGLDLGSDDTGYVTLSNLEIFDNGIAERWQHGWRSNGSGVRLAGHDITIERSLIHDNGQDEISDRSTGVPGIGHLPLHDIVIRDSWLYNRRQDPLYPGFGFNSGSQAVAEQDCTHVDGLQVWGGGLHQQRFTVESTIFGPMVSQGFYPGDRDKASFDNVTLTDVIFLNPLTHGINGDLVTSDSRTPGHWHLDRVTSYLTSQPLAGTATHGSVDLAGADSSVTRSIFVNGYFASPASFTTAKDNIYWGGEPVPGGTRVNPRFCGPAPAAGPPSFAALSAMVLRPTCELCSGRGARLAGVHDLLTKIDLLDEGASI